MKIGVIGAGTMGQGIAQAFASYQEYQVVLCDVSEELAQRGRQAIETGLKKQEVKGRYTKAEVDGIIRRIQSGIVRRVSDCDLVIEAVAEKMEIKKQLFSQLDELCKESTIFATNTSSLSITEISNQVKRPVIGMHFFNPVPVMKLVEVVRGMDTPDSVVSEIISIARSIGKEPVEVSEQPGFVVNRILIPMINEAIGVYAMGAASVSDIDAAMKMGANHPIGPLALGDLVGLDVCLAIMETLLAETGDSKYRPEPLLRKMVRGGLLGKKSGKGFYQY